MLKFRALALLFALMIATVVNLFFAPHISSSHPPNFSAADFAANEGWIGHGFGLHPSWLARTLPNSTFINVRVGKPDWVIGEGGPIGVLWDVETVTIENLSVDESEFPLDISGYGLRSQISQHHRLTALIRCHADPLTSGRDLCDYFVAWDESVTPSDSLTFVAVFSSTSPETNEVGFIERGLLERLIDSGLDSVPRIGDQPR
jgi:hypothetical protein